ncbi:thermostable hemolysin [Ferrovibrio xuzhouensis]|uniref:Thermostable hemolysin n=1 Tax=Ferrovibrio xuzhouensis TaxID=1576914 RepID=A0ABV7VGE3_9PROT
MQFIVVPQHSERRIAVEQMVSAVFLDEYGAMVSRFPDIMVAVLDDSDHPVCAASLRNHAGGLFSEQYLDEPVEAAIAAASGQSVRRDAILELGSLAAARPGALLILLAGFATLGLASGHRWGLFTASRRLRCFADRLAIPLLDLGPAEAARVPDPAAWGRYYECAPRVCAVDGLSTLGQLDHRKDMPAAPAGPILTAGLPQIATAAIAP